MENWLSIAPDYRKTAQKQKYYHNDNTMFESLHLILLLSCKDSIVKLEHKGHQKALGPGCMIMVA